MRPLGIDDNNKKRHRDRKSPGAAEVWRKQKKARNAARGKQVWHPLFPPINEDGVIVCGYWKHIIAGSQESLAS